MNPTVVLSRTPGRRVLLAVAIVLSSLLVGAPAADAHLEDDYMPNHWSSWPGVIVEYVTTFPANSPYPFRDRVADGAANWSGVANKPSLSYEQSIFDWYPYEGQLSCGQMTERRVGVHFKPLSGSTIGYARICHTAGAVWASQMIIDSDETWWPYNDAPLSGWLDLESVTTHEWGHVRGGWVYAAGHWSHGSNGATCNSAPKDTMCPATSAGDDSQRTPTALDIHPANEAYS